LVIVHVKAFCQIENTTGRLKSERKNIHTYTYIHTNSLLPRVRIL
jgi:hypothetical protein